MSPSTIRHAGELVTELKDLKHEMKNALVDVVQWKVPYQQDVQIDTVGNNALADFTSFTSGPFPIDDYLKSGANVTTSPYPKLRAGAGKSGNAPVIASYTDAEETLQKVMTSRAYLHDNLDAILRHHNDAEVVNFIEELTRDASAGERFRIKKMVDELIAGMNSELEREIMEDMLKVQNQPQNRSVMIPERDTNSKVKAGKPGVRGRVNVGSRIDSGLRKGGKPAEIPAKKPKVFVGARTPPKSVAFTARPKPVAKKKAQESETYLTRVYGKALYHSSRNSQRDPKIRYNAASPTSKLAHSPSRITKKTLAGAGDPRDAAPRGNVEHYFFSPSNRGQQQPQPQNVGSKVTHALGMEGELVPMAIPLGAPRQKTGAPPPPLYVPGTPNLPGTSPFASTPLEGHQTPRPQVSIHTEDSSMPRSEAEERAMMVETPRDSPKKAKDQALSPIRLPSRDASASSETATTAVHKVSPPQPLPEESQGRELVVEEANNADGYDDDFEDSDDTVTESHEEGVIDLPGYSQPPAGPHHGPKFPPQAPGLNNMQSSDVVGTDIKRMDLLANHAVEWIEQELMARMLSEIAEKRALEEAMHGPPPVDVRPRAPRPPRSPNDSEYSSDESLIPSAREPLIAGSIGRDGLQMFIDAGMPVDEHLVNALIQDVILEKISSMMGQHGSQEEVEPPPRMPAREEPPEPKPRSRPTSPFKQSSSLDNQLPPRKNSPLSTPELTPRSSPLMSPRHTRGSPPETPDLTPAVSLTENLPVPIKIAPRQLERQLERQESVERQDSIDDSDTIEEYIAPPLNTRDRDAVSPTFMPRHDVRTPSMTPPRSPVSEAYTPEVSVEEPALEEKQPEPIKVETRDTGVMVNFVKIIRDYEIDSPEVIAYRNTETQTMETKPVSPEPVPVPEPKEPTPPPSPKPWGNQEDSIQEEALTDQDVDQNELQDDRRAREPKRTIPATIATQTSRRSPSPSPSNTQDESTVSSVVSHDDAISEGEWLLTLHSEGEVRPMPLAHAHGHQFTPGRGRPTDDTLHDMDDVDLDHEGRELSTDFEPSEGEFLHESRVPPEQDPMLSYLYQMQNNPMKILEQQLRMNQLAAAAGANMNNYGLQAGMPVNKSLGEVSFGIPQMPQQPQSVQQHFQQNQQPQQQTQDRPAPKSILVQPGKGTSSTNRLATSVENRSVGEVLSPGLVDGNSTSDSISDIQEYSVPPVVAPRSSIGNLGDTSPKTNLELKPTEPTENININEPNPNHLPPSGNGVSKEPQESNRNDITAEQLNDSLGMTGGSVSSTRDPPMRLAEARKSGSLGGPIMSTENIRGGRRGARPGSSRGRLVYGRSSTPDEGHGRHMSMRASQDSDLKDTLESVDGLKSTGGSDFRTMTPDQMNVDALLQSGQYLNQTMSSDGGSTTDFGRTGELGTVRSTEFSQTTMGEEDHDEYQTREEYSRHLRVSRSEVIVSKSYDSRGSTDLGTRSAEFVPKNYQQHNLDYGTQSAEFGTESREENLPRNGRHEGNGVQMSGTFGRSGRLTYTTSEFGHSESEYNYSGRFSENGETQDLQASGHYADSLEGTGELTYTGALRRSYEDSDNVRGSDRSPGSRSGPIQVSVTIPSMAQSESGSDDGGSGSVEDVSEISLGK